VTIFQAMLALSSSSKRICERMIRPECRLHADLLLYLNWDTLTGKTLDDTAAASKRTLVEKEMGILHNLVRNVERARGSCRRRDAVEILQKFRSTAQYPVCDVYSLAEVVECAPLGRADLRFSCFGLYSC